MQEGIKRISECHHQQQQSDKSMHEGHCGHSAHESQQHQTKPEAKSGQWTCPMHPEVIRDEPGSCPICGMALEPVTVSLEDTESPELTSMTRRFWISAVLSVPVAAGVLYPLFGLLLSPILAAVAMTFSSVSVIGNALRLNRAAI